MSGQVLKIGSHGREDAPGAASAAGAPLQSEHHSPDVQRADSRLTEQQREGRAWFDRMVARAIHDNGGETRAGKRIGKLRESASGRLVSSFVRARIEGRLPWVGGDAIAALSVDGLEDLGKAILARAETLRGVFVSSLPVLVRAQRLHRESSEAHQAVLAVAVLPDASPGERIIQLRAALSELRDASRETDAAIRDIEQQIRELEGA